MIDPANEVHRVAHVIETTARGLKRKRHQKHLIRGQGAIEKAMRSFFRRQEVAVVAALKPKIGPALSADPAPIKEASSGGKRFASTLLPTSLQPLTFQLDTEEASAYTEAISDMITSAGATLAKEMGSKLGAIKDQLDDVAARYMRTESLSKLTGGLNETSTDRLRTAIGDAWDQGGSYDQIVSAVRGTFDDFSETRAGLIAQTEATDAYNEGRSATAKALGFDEKSWEVESDNPCPECLGNVDDGWIDFDDTFSSGDDAPTAHPNCFLGSTPIVAFGVSHAIRRWYEGDICILRFAGLPDLSVTPNHPILGTRGWVHAGRMKPGDYVQQCIFPALSSIASHPDNHHMEASIQEIFDTLVVSGRVLSTGMPVSTKAFHGDGGVNGKVDIVGADRSVSLNVKSLQNAANVLFCVAEGQRVALDSESAYAELDKISLGSSDRVMSRAGIGGADIGRRVRRTKKTGGAHVALLETKSVPVTNEGQASHADSQSDLLDGVPVQMRFVELLEIERRQFAGHVFNLSTDSELYFAGTIVAHNCECILNFRSGA